MYVHIYIDSYTYTRPKQTILRGKEPRPRKVGLAKLEKAHRPRFRCPLQSQLRKCTHQSNPAGTCPSPSSDKYSPPSSDKYTP